MRNILTVLLMVGALLGSVAIAAPEDDGELRIGGSTTLLPIVSAAASEFMEKYGTWDKVDPKLPAKKIVIYLTGGGSGFGVQSIIQDVNHIGLVSRDLKDKEKGLLGAHRTIMVGKDAVAFVTNKANPLAQKRIDLTKAQITSILAGEVNSYREIDRTLPASNIAVFVRDSGAGSAELVQSMVMGDKQVSKNALQFPSQGALLKKIESNNSAFAYISAGLIAGSSKLHPHAYEGMQPTSALIVSGEYKLSRPLLLLVKEPHSGMIDHFVDFLLNDGQKLLQEAGYVPVKVAAKTPDKKDK